MKLSHFCLFFSSLILTACMGGGSTAEVQQPMQPMIVETITEFEGGEAIITEMPSSTLREQAVRSSQLPQ